MKILHVITSLVTGGAEKLLVDLLPLLSQSGNEVDLLLFYGQRTPFCEELERRGIKIYSLSNSPGMYKISNLFKLFFYIRKYDVVHTHLTAPQLFASICSLFCSTLLCTTEHNTTNRRRDWQWYFYLDKWMYSRYKKIVCISDKAETNLREYLRDDSSKIVTIYNGIDTCIYKSAKPDERFINSKGARIAIVMVSTFRDQKDQDTLIKSMNLLPANYVLWLVGDGERREELERLTDTLKLRNKVIFWGNKTNIPEILKASDVIVMSSHFEGLSLSSIEGMAAGKPFIASDVDGLREVTEDAGILFEHQNEKDLATKIKMIVDDSSLYKEVSRKCCDRSKKYDIHITTERYNMIYNELWEK
jgi:glycosyltransferase involved in cell wall biosynthesis